MMTRKGFMVSVSLGAWSGRKVDRSVTQDVTDRWGAKSGTGAYTKVLLPGDVLDEIYGLDGQIRNWVYSVTVPWMDGGLRMLPASFYMNFAQKMSEFRMQREALVDRLVAVYEELKSKAREDLGGMYCENDYPSTGAIRGRFYMNVVVMPLPEHDQYGRYEITDEEKRLLEREYRERMRRSVDEALRDLLSRLKGALERFHERMEDPDKIFKNSLVENLRVLVRETIPRLNMFEDRALETLRREVEERLGALDPDALRKDTALRKNAANAARQILEKMGAYYDDAAAAA
jgi:hypothetical protein